MKKNKIDYHIHSQFSSDSLIQMEQLVVKAIKNGYKDIAITEHFDFGSYDIAEYGLPPLLAYYREFKRVKKKFPEINILFGAEIGEYHKTNKLANKIFAFAEPELKIASIHILNGEKNISTPLNFKLSKEDIIRYYQDNLEMVEFGNFDILGHLGIFKRYFTQKIDEKICNNIINQIFEVIIRKEIALEINYSSLRKAYNSILPEPEYLKIFLKMGGKIITIGSDSHSLETFDDYYSQTIQILKNVGFQNVYKKSGGEWLAIKI